MALLHVCFSSFSFVIFYFATSSMISYCLACVTMNLSFCFSFSIFVWRIKCLMPGLSEFSISSGNTSYINSFLNLGFALISSPLRRKLEHQRNHMRPVLSILKLSTIRSMFLRPKVKFCMWYAILFACWTICFVTYSPRSF